MGFLDELKKRLTTPGGEAFSRERFEQSRPEYLRARLPDSGQTADIIPPYLFEAAQYARRRRRRLLLGFALVLLLLTAAGGTVGGIAWYRVLRTVGPSQVLLSVAGPERVVSGEDVNLRLRLENGSRVPWENVVLTFTIPSGFALKQVHPAPASGPLDAAHPPSGPLTFDVGTLPARASAEVTLTGRLFGEEGTSVLFTARTTLAPSPHPSLTVEKSTVSSVIIASVPVDLTIDVPRTAASGTPITVSVVVQNRLAHDLEGARLLLESPPGFVLKVATPPVESRELQFDLPALPPQDQHLVTVGGVISGDPETAKPFTAKVGFLTPDGRFIVARSIQRSLTIERAALSLSQLYHNEADLLKADPGAEIPAKVRYQNTGTTGLREVIVRLAFQGVGLDEQSVDVEGGFFDSRRKQITWSAASRPGLRVLRPGEAGELTFTFRLLPPSALPFARPEDRNYVLKATATADSPDLPVPPGAPKQVVTDEFEILLNTVPAVTRDAFLDDGRAGLPVSAGSLPPMVGKETTFTVRARIANTSNEIIDATVQTVLPEGVRWVGKEYHTVGEVRFNERTRDVIWTIPLIPARAGTALLGPEFAFQVGITPSLNQLGSIIALTRVTTLQGTDAHTTAIVRAEAEAVTTETVDPEHAAVVR